MHLIQKKLLMFLHQLTCSLIHQYNWQLDIIGFGYSLIPKKKCDTMISWWTLLYGGQIYCNIEYSNAVKIVAHRPDFDGESYGLSVVKILLQYCHNELDVISNDQPHDCLPNCLFRRRSKKTSKLRVTGLCEGNSPVSGEFPAQRASNVENVSIWWCHHMEENWPSYNSLSISPSDVSYNWDSRSWHGHVMLICVWQQIHHDPGSGVIEWNIFMMVMSHGKYFYNSWTFLQCWTYFFTFIFVSDVILKKKGSVLEKYDDIIWIKSSWSW